MPALTGTATGTPLPRIMMVSSEASPWAKSGGLADVLEALPKALAAAGHRVSVVIPRYMHALAAPAERVIDVLPITLGGAVYDTSILRSKQDGVTIFYVEHAGIYGRDGLYGDQFGDYGDNHIRFAVLCKAALEISRTLFPTDIYHCHDWQAGLLPLYLKAFGTEPEFANARTVMTIHNLGYQGIFPRAKMADISLPDWLFRTDLIEFWGNINLLKAGLVYADEITTVSRRYAEEIQTPEHGFGLDGLLRARSESLIGIVNGVNYTRWNPESDKALPENYSAAALEGKLACKRELLREMGLPDRAIGRPLLGIVSRFAYQKGFDLIASIGHTLFQDDVHMVVLGNGDGQYEEYFRNLRASFPEKVALRIGYDDGLAHRIEAGSDIFLMPSRYEPCGLNQIYSLRYGTVPVVRATGGLDDTIDPSTGFKFTDYNGRALLETIRLACRAWEDREAWTRMMRRGMAKDFSWDASAAEYSRLYQNLHPFAG
ncbi:MAG TPA: glycogen synthase GlgA [Bryobacteraceae bacterium]|nr:glycogen synthase GlgA [Bryobacteraceae bacterium]